MDPYLENPGLWPDVHHTLISGYRDFLAAQLRPKYVVRVEERTYMADESDAALALQVRIPDVEVASSAGMGRGENLSGSRRPRKSRSPNR